MFGFKQKIKLFFFQIGYKIEKIYVQKNYNQTSPKLELLKKMVECSGILHLGAHRGSESATYEYFGKKVIWVEANPRIFLDLKINLKKYIFQDPFCQLLSNKDDILTLYIFEYIANKYQKSDRFNIDIHVDINENTPELIT